MKSYPAAYKPDARNRADFQQQEYRRFDKPGSPANDNFPKPANDNNRGIGKPPGGLGAYGKFARGAAKGFKFGFKFTPWGRFFQALEFGYDLYQYFKGQDAGYDMGGWELEYDCGKPIDTPPLPTYYAGSTFCTQIRAINKSQANKMTCTSTYCRVGYLDVTIGNSTFYRGYMSQQWRKLVSESPTVPVYKDASNPIWLPYEGGPYGDPAGNPNGSPSGSPASPAGPSPAPMYPPFGDPNSLPIGSPAPTPKAPPYKWLPKRVPNPWRAPGERSERGNGDSSPKLPAKTPPIVLSPPGSAPRVSPPYKNAPPPGGTKERKFVLAISGVPAKIINITSEYGDFLDSLYDALPDKRKVKGANGIERSEIVYRYFDEIDINEALINLGLNHIEDLTFGIIGRQVARASRRHGFAAGIQLGPVH